MKIALNITVEVDPEDWTSDFDVAPKDIPEDVREYCRSVLQAQFERNGHGSVICPDRAAPVSDLDGVAWPPGDPDVEALSGPARSL